MIHALIFIQSVKVTTGPQISKDKRITFYSMQPRRLVSEDFVKYRKSDTPSLVSAVSSAERFPRKRSGLKSSASSPWRKPRVTSKHTIGIVLTHIDCTITIDTPGPTFSFDRNRSLSLTPYHMLDIHIVPLGMKYPSYQSSCICKHRKRGTLYDQMILPLSYSAAPLLHIQFRHAFRNISLKTPLT